MAAETSIVTGLSGRYARALFEMARDAKALDQVGADLDRLQTMLRDSADLTSLTHSPVIPRGQQAKALLALAEKAQMGDLVRRFLGVVAANRRLSQLGRVIADFKALLARHRGEMLARVTSAMPLSQAQQDSLAAALKAATGHAVSIDAKVDASLLGGLVVQVGSRRMDASVKNQLETLQAAMKGVA